MSNYTKQISWSGKDALSDSDPEKVISGGDFDTEFSAVQTAINSKIDTGGVVASDIASNAITDAKISGMSSSKLSGALPAISGANLTGLPAGSITEADQWRKTVDQGVQAGAYTITNNWERVDTANFEKLGTGMTEASGAFTFPSTGYWLIDHHLRGNQVTGATRSVFFSIQVSTDSGSSYTAATSGAICIPDAASGTDYMSGDTKHILKVTNASTFRVLFNGNSAAYFVIDGNTSQTETSAIFMKLGDI